MAQDELASIRQGAAAFRNARYPEAVAAFQKASDANPKSPAPHLYLALAWFQQYIPHAISADSTNATRRAEAEFQRALALDPTNWLALAMLGQLAFGESRFDASREWYRKALAVEPANADTWCMLGAVDWWQWRS
jgi:Flp pilus assembly protein TadD